MALAAGAGPSRQAGISLIELIIAMGLSALVIGMGLALFKDIGAAARFIATGRDNALETRAQFNALCDNLLAGQGVLFLSPQNLRVLNVGGMKVDYAWEESTFTVNGRPLGFRLAEMQIDAWGPTLPPGEDWSRDRMEFADVDSLDDDRDGEIDFEELDRDRSGDLNPHEARYVARFAIRLKTVHKGIATEHKAQVHPRNHAREWTDDALDVLPGTGDFGL